MHAIIKDAKDNIKYYEEKNRRIAKKMRKLQKRIAKLDLELCAREEVLQTMRILVENIEDEYEK